MKIGIDVSQLTYRNTGVANYLKHLIKVLVESDRENEYILFYSSLRGKLDPRDIPTGENVKVIKSFLPPTVLDFLWNKLHIVPIETFTGSLDIFITSDWVEPPARKAKKATILYDLVVYKFPDESTPKIVQTQKRKLYWVKKESAAVLCISDATKRDVKELLGIDEKKLHIIYPGFTL
jgi:hypothetical protein